VISVISNFFIFFIFNLKFLIIFYFIEIKMNLNMKSLHIESTIINYLMIIFRCINIILNY